MEITIFKWIMLGFICLLIFIAIRDIIEIKGGNDGMRNIH